MNDLEILLSPTHNDINDIEQWLEAEYKKSRSGFYTDRDVLHQSFRDERLIILKIYGKAVSFISWKSYVKHTAQISIAETHPDFRRKGFARILLNALISSFQKKDIHVINLQSISDQSETAWKHLGFTEFPEDKNKKGLEEKELFKIIVPVLETDNVATSDTLELWHMDSHAISGVDPNASWSLSFIDDSRILQNPIVYPAHYDWHLCWTKDGVIAYEGRLKRFPVLISFGRFMIIRSLFK